MEVPKLKKNISNYLVNLTSIKENLAKTQLTELKNLLDEAQKLSAEQFVDIAGGRSYECYIFEINKRLGINKEIP